MRSSIGGLFALLLLGTSGYAQTADKILFNGKIVTVDDRFTIAQALAISGERIVAVGSNADIEKLKTPTTEAINLQGRTVIPGLIDNHAHFMRAAEYWDREVRLDGVATHRQALDLIAAKAAASKPGDWVLVLGGWSEEQFTDEKRGFTRAELDAAAPHNPVVVQLIYFRIYANTPGLTKLGIDAETPDPRNGKIEKGADAQPTGVLNGGGAVAFTLARLGKVDPQRLTENARALMHDLNGVGLTAYGDMGGRGMSPEDQATFATLAAAKQLTVRVFNNFWSEAATPAQVDDIVARIATLKPFHGDDWFAMTGYGESAYTPANDNLLAANATPAPNDLAQVRRVMQALADRGVSLNVHAQLHNSIEAFLDQIEAVDRERPIKALRWTLSHADQLVPADLDRLRRLGMGVELHSRPSIQGALMLKVHGEKTFDMPPLRMVRDSGLHWGLGSDATAVTPSNPFYTLGWAVTGKMLGGEVVLHQTISREDALIAHTRANAYFVFQEENLGSLQPGKYADLLVLDRDYLTVPADEIKDIVPVMTMVAGKPVYSAPAP